MRQNSKKIGKSRQLDEGVDKGVERRQRADVNCPDTHEEYSTGERRPEGTLPFGADDTDLTREGCHVVAPECVDSSSGGDVCADYSAENGRDVHY